MITGAVQELVAGNQLITFGDWSDLKRKVEQYPLYQTEDDFLDDVGIKRDFYNKITGFAIRGWRESTSRSLFQIIGHHGLDVPEKGKPIFKNHLEQTRFFHLLDEGRILGKFGLGHVVDENNEKVKVAGGNVALTYPQNESRRASTEKIVNEVLQAVFIYAFLCKQKEMKLPKKLYRGIRLSDMRNIPGLKEELSVLKYDPSTRSDYYREYVRIVCDYINEHGLNGIAESSLLSFTASKSVASYFANKRGLVLEVEAQDVEILTSELHDERLDVMDYMSGKKEREYIVRLPKEQVEVKNIMIHDLDFFIATSDPRAVSLFNHNDKIAYYELNEVKIKAQFHWSTNTKGSIAYYNLSDNGWGYGSREFQKEYGFSPVITNKNIKEVKNFRIEHK